MTNNIGQRIILLVGIAALVTLQVACLFYGLFLILLVAGLAEGLLCALLATYTPVRTPNFYFSLIMYVMVIFTMCIDARLFYVGSGWYWGIKLFPWDFLLLSWWIYNLLGRCNEKE